jgi:hypothetical protein
MVNDSMHEDSMRRCIPIMSGAEKWDWRLDVAAPGLQKLNSKNHAKMNSKPQPSSKLAFFSPHHPHSNLSA